MLSGARTLLLSSLLLSAAPGSASALPLAANVQSTSPTVRVGLVRTLGAPSRLRVNAGVPVSLAEKGAQPVGIPGGDLMLSIVEGSVVLSDTSGRALSSGPSVRIQPAESGGVLCAAAPGQKARRYRGVLEARIAGKVLRVVNELPMEDYLRGVVALEMPASAPSEALKAQAVVARSYAARCAGRYRSQGYDLTDTTDCQMYGGADAERPSTDAAVHDTAGAVLMYAGRVVYADYYDNCGGVTSGGEGDTDYPPSVVDAPEGGSDYCAAGPHHEWTLRLSPAEIKRALGGSVPVSIGAIRSVEVVSHDASGRARKVRVVGEAGSVEVNGYQFRAAVGYGRLRSTLFTVSQGTDGVLAFAGKGWGHGHGLCQEGAMGMAAPPYAKRYQEILQHYYPGSSVRPMGNVRR